MATSSSVYWLERDNLQALIDALHADRYEVLAPTIHDGSVEFGRVRDVDQLPIGWQDHQGPGSYRLEKTESSRVFDVVNGPGSVKRHVFTPREPLLQIQIRGSDGDFSAEPTIPDAPRLAILGVRPCDVAALRIQDRVFLGDRYPDPYYDVRREGILVIAVNCTRSVDTCFCTSMGSGPECQEGYDLSLTESDGGFVCRAGSDSGFEILRGLELAEAEAEALQRERADLDACAQGITRKLDTSDMPELLYSNLEHPRWDDVAERCLSCGNCTMVCPTCFCHDEWDEPTLDGESSLRVRVWDSCLNREHAQIHGFNPRSTIRDRYRQWLVHKVASWIDQFGSSGCVGCGRCITWCPVGIDLTEEIAQIRATADE